MGIVKSTGFWVVSQFIRHSPRKLPRPARKKAQFLASLRSSRSRDWIGHRSSFPYIFLYHSFVFLQDEVSRRWLLKKGWGGIVEVAAHLQVAKESIYCWVDSKGFPAHRVGRLLRFRILEVDEWVKSG